MKLLQIVMKKNMESNLHVFFVKIKKDLILFDKIRENLIFNTPKSTLKIHSFRVFQFHLEHVIIVIDRVFLYEELYFFALYKCKIAYICAK